MKALRLLGALALLALTPQLGGCLQTAQAVSDSIDAHLMQRGALVQSYFSVSGPFSATRGWSPGAPFPPNSGECNQYFSLTKSTDRWVTWEGETVYSRRRDWNSGESCYVDSSAPSYGHYRPPRFD